MPHQSTDPTANNHPVPSGGDTVSEPTAYPKVPEDSRVISLEETALGMPAAMRSIDTAK
jgi:hypothetical protein